MSEDVSPEALAAILAAGAELHLLAVRRAAPLIADNPGAVAAILAEASGRMFADSLAAFSATLDEIIPRLVSMANVQCRCSIQMAVAELNRRAADAPRGAGLN